MRRNARFGVAYLCSLLIAGCADLSPISVDVCGNGVVEPARGEDCDGAAPTGSTCGAPGTPRACRYLCETEVDCPTDFSCGQDGLCRASSATWSTTPSAPKHTTETPLDIVVADADHDGLADVFEEAPDYVRVHYDVTSSTEAELTVPRDATLPAIGPVADLSGDGYADAVIPADLGYFVSLGNAARIERATAYGAVPLGRDVTDVQALSADVLPQQPGSEILVLGVLSVAGAPAAPVLVDVGITTGTLSFIGQLPDAPSKLAGPVRAGRLNEDDAVVPCEELVLAYQGKASLDLLVPCAVDARGNVSIAANATTTSVELPRGAKVAGGVTLEDVDRDGHLDLVVPAARGANFEIDVAYGRGDGSFDSTPGADPTTRADGAAGTSVTVKSGVPLAVFDLDGDLRPDWVDATGIHLSKEGSASLSAYNHGSPWTSALIAPFDGDALPDVAVGSSESPGITVFLNAGAGTLSPFPVQTVGNVTRLVSGDFDGDRVGDLAVVTTTRATTTGAMTSSSTSDTLSVVFGSAFGAPTPPKDIGEFQKIDFLATGRVGSGEPLVVDGADELGAVAEDADGVLAFAIIFGQGNRELRSPYDLARASINDADVTGYTPFRIVTGDIDGDGSPDVISLGQNIVDPADNRIWSNPMSGDASIHLAQSTYSDAIASTFDWPHVLVGALDLDGKPGDEVVILGPRADGAGYQSGVAHASAAAASGPTYSLAAPTKVDLTFTRTETVLPDPSMRNGRLRVADLDGDGMRDVVALGQKAGRGKLVVFFTDGDGALGAATAPTGMEQLDVRDFAVVQAPGDARPRLAMLTTTGIYVVTSRGRELTVNASPALSMTANTPTSPALIGAGDIDGDGVPDLTLAGPLGFEVHLGISGNVTDRR